MSSSLISESGKPVALKKAITQFIFALAPITLLSACGGVSAPDPNLRTTDESTNAAIVKEVSDPNNGNNSNNNSNSDNQNGTDNENSENEEKTISDADLIKGALLYRDTCRECHSILVFSEQRGRSAEEIQVALINQEDMRDLSVTEEEIYLISLALNNAIPDSLPPIKPVDPIDPDKEGFKALFEHPDINCTSSSCHDATPGVAHTSLMYGSLAELATRLVNTPATNTNCYGELLIDRSAPENSLLLKLIDPNSGPQCISKMPFDSDGIPEEYVEFFKDWVDDIIAAYIPPELPPEEPETVTVLPNDPLTLGQKIKFIIHGGALTDDELSALSNEEGQLNPTALSSMIDQWMNSPNYATKLKQFLKIALQQKTVDGRYVTQLNTITNSNAHRRIRENLEESFTRTALRIALNDQDFRDVITTQEWEMSTVMLAALAYADHHRRPRQNLSRFHDTPFVDTDFTDWRTVKLQMINGNSPYTDHQAFKTEALVESFRAIQANDTFKLATPRVGFFTTPTFFDQWQTNGANQFRLNTNQTLITALGLTFSSGDPTLPNQVHLDQIDPDHAPAGSDCFGCHKNLDPMRNVFLNYFQPNNFRARQNLGNLNDYFAFQGKRSSIQDIVDFARDVASHDHLAKGWALRVCQSISSTTCNDYNEEINQIASTFEQSGYRFNALMKAVLLSPIVTSTSIEEHTNHPGAHISIARQDHFCSALQSRLQTIRDLREFPNANPDQASFIDICYKNNRLRALANTIPNDDFARGTVELIQASNTDPFLSSAYHKFCNETADDVVGNNNAHTFKTNNINQSLNDMTEHLLGIPASSAYYQQSRDGLQRLYDVARHNTQCADTATLSSMIQENGEIRCGLNLNATQALRLTWVNSSIPVSYRCWALSGSSILKID